MKEQGTSMTLEEKYKLSCYEELTKLHDNKPIFLVRNNEDGNLYIKKKIGMYNKLLYQKLSESNIENIPKIYLIVEDEGWLIVIEEYIHGTTLKKIVEKNGSISKETATSYLIMLCEIIEILHNFNPPLIHRDIKPSNIMVSNDNVIKLLYFNAAKEYVNGNVEDTMLIGTKEFAAPEQYGFKQSDCRTDIYVIEITLNYLLTGAVPKEKRYNEILSDIIEKCTELDPKNGYQDIYDLKDDLLKSKRELELEQSKTPESDDKNIKCEMTKERNREHKVNALYDYKWFLPVGFRNRKIWKIIVAVIGYMLLFNLIFTMEFKDKAGVVIRRQSRIHSKIIVLTSSSSTADCEYPL